MTSPLGIPTVALRLGSFQSCSIGVGPWHLPLVVVPGVRDTWTAVLAADSERLRMMTKFAVAVHYSRHIPFISAVE